MGNRKKTIPFPVFISISVRNTTSMGPGETKIVASEDCIVLMQDNHYNGDTSYSLFLKEETQRGIYDQLSLIWQKQNGRAGFLVLDVLQI